MDDMISRKAALNVLHGYFDGMLETDTVCTKDLYNEIEELPSVDAVEVVRCKECKHNPNDTLFEYAWFECPIANLPYDENRWRWNGERKDG